MTLFMAYATICFDMQIIAVRVNFKDKRGTKWIQIR